MATVQQPQSRGWLPSNLLIAGRAERGRGETVTVYNPSSGGITARLPGASLDQFREAIAAARAHADKGEWGGMDALDRIAILRRFLRLLGERSEDFRSLMVTETGVPIKSFALDAQFGSPLRQMAAMFDLYLKLPQIDENPLPLDERVNPFGGFLQSVRRYIPVGVVAAISAYNFPLHISLWKVMTALATGNCVLLRPSPLTPLSALALAEVASAAELPPSIFQVLIEAGSEGATLMTTDPAVDMVSFTGSTVVAAKLLHRPRPR